MRREVSLEEISDGRLYGPNDMVKADCQDCKGCSDCCRGMGESIVLDPLDIFRLSSKLGQTFEQMLTGALELHVVDGVILPNLKMTGQKEQCVFLNEQGRCSIHDARPGICRLFPLGRYYEEGRFHYILLTGECKKESRSKVKVRKWVDTPELKKYETFVTEWHYFLKELEKRIENSQEDVFVKNVNMYVLKQFYTKGYEEKEDFYIQFERRLTEAKEVLGI